MKKTNFDKYLEQQLRDPAFAARFEKAGEARDVALQITALRTKAGLSQKDLAKLLKISQQQISRLESPGYEGHSLSTLRRIAKLCTPVSMLPSSRRAGGRARVWRRPLRDMEHGALRAGGDPHADNANMQIYQEAAS
jgi:transcriptional regulator with XRE-family HTH domain